MRNKRAYSKPILESEAFVPQEYVAKCANHVIYYGTCDISGYVFEDKGQLGVYEPGIDTYKYRNTKCNRTFETSEQPHQNAFIFQRIDTKKVQVGTGWFGRPIYDYITVGVGDPVPIYNFDDTHANFRINDTAHHNVS